MNTITTDQLKTSQEHLKQIENIQQTTDANLKSTFQIDEKDAQDYQKLQDIYTNFIETKPSDWIKKIQKLLIDYITTYKNSSENIQGIFEWRLEKFFKKNKKMNFLLKQIEREWWLLKYGEKRLGIK